MTCLNGMVDDVVALCQGQHLATLWDLAIVVPWQDFDHIEGAIAEIFYFDRRV